MKIFVAGGAGFIGSSLAKALLSTMEESPAELVSFDNFSSGTARHLSDISDDPRFTSIRGDINDQESVNSATIGADVIFHFASNPDIAKAAIDPTIDFSEGTVLTQNLLEAARINQVGVFIYASGSGVYGDLPGLRLKEDYGPLKPISPYGASKLAGEAMVSAYSHMFGIKARSLRFANVIGSNQTHGVTFDFVNRLISNPRSLEVLGDGTQTKPYIHVDDIVQALVTSMSDAIYSGGYKTFNVSTDDEVEVRDIVEICLRRFGLYGLTQVSYGSGSRGWAGDVPKVSLDSSALRSLGWKPEFSSKHAVQKAIDGYLEHLGIEPKSK